MINSVTAVPNFQMSSVFCTQFFIAFEFIFLTGTVTSLSRELSCWRNQTDDCLEWLSMPCLQPKIPVNVRAFKVSNSKCKIKLQFIQLKSLGNEWESKLIILKVTLKIGLTFYSIKECVRRQLRDVLLPQPRLLSLVVRIVSDFLQVEYSFSPKTCLKISNT